MPTEISGSTGVNKIQDNTIVNADINSSAAIAGSKLVMPTGSELQVVEGGVSGTSAHSAGSGNYSTVFSATLTNVQANSKVIVLTNAYATITNTGSDVAFSVWRGSTSLGGTEDGNDKAVITGNLRRNAGIQNIKGTGMFLDTNPGTGSVQYDFKVNCENTVTFGRNASTGDATLLQQRTRTTMILMEIAG